jgi:hypothetical protein
MSLFARNFLIFLFLLLAISSAEAQLYQIRLMTTNTEVPEGYFDALKDIGVIHQQKEDGITKVYLGNYWGRPTADYFLALVNERGFESAYLTNQELDPEELYALQFLAVSTLNVQALPKEIHPHLLIIEHEGVYRLSLGLTAAQGSKFQMLKGFLEEMGRERYWLRRLWRPTAVELLKNTEVINTDDRSKNNEQLPTVKKNPKAKLRPSKIPDEPEQ